MPVIRNRFADWSKDAALRPFVAYCGAPGCFLNASYATESEAKDKLDSHDCPVEGGKTRYNMTGPSILEQAWMALDVCVDFIMSHREGNLTGYTDEQMVDLRDQVKVMKARAGGIASIISLFHGSHYPTETDVSREAARRWQAKEAGDLTYETQGLRRFDPPKATWTKPENNPALQNEPQSTKRTATTKPRETLTDDEKDTVRQFKEAFTAEQLAGTLGKPARVIQEYLDSLVGA